MEPEYYNPVALQPSITSTLSSLPTTLQPANQSLQSIKPRNLFVGRKTLNTLGKVGVGLVQPYALMGQTVSDLLSRSNTIAANATTNANSSVTGTQNASTTSLSPKAQKGLDIANVGLSLLDNNVKAFQRDYSGKRGNLTKGLDTAFDATATALMAAVPGIGTAIGAAMKAGSMVGKAMQNYLGTGTDGMTTGDAILNSSFFALSPISWINGWTGKKADVIRGDQQVLSSSSYADTAGDIENALTYSGKKYGGFSNRARIKANRKIAAAKADQFTTKDILTEAGKDFLRQNTSQDMYSNRRQLLNGGFNMNNIAFGRDGMKIKNINDTKEFLKNLDTLKKKRKEDEEFNKELSNPTSKNLLPSGALHARLHHIEQDGVITNKGIPVLEKEGGEIKQIAEIEKEEIIFRECITKKLEELSKEGTDEAAIEAGKILVNEILFNTIDEDKFIEKVE